MMNSCRLFYYPTGELVFNNNCCNSSRNTKLKVLCDNIRAICLGQNPIFHNRMQHVAIDFHLVQDQVERNQVFANQSTINQVADAFTKSLPKRLCTVFVFKIGLKPIEPILQRAYGSLRTTKI